MEEYLFIYLLIVIGGVLFRGKEYRKPFLYCVIFFLSLSVAIRDGVGTDYETYYRNYEETNSLKNVFESVVDYGYSLLGLLIKSVGFKEPYVFFFIISFLSFYFFYKAILRFKMEKYSVEIFLLYLSFFFLNYHYNIIRHGLMTSIAWYAFTYIPEKRYRRFVFFMLLAGMFHKLAFFLLPFYWIDRIKLKKIHVVLLFISIFFGIFLSKMLIPFLIKVIPINSIKYALTFYAYTYYWAGDTQKEISIGVVVYTFLFLFIFIKRKKMSEIYGFTLLFNSLFLSLIFFFLLSSVGVFVERVTGLFYISLCFLIPIVMVSFGTKNSRLVYYMIFFAFCTLLLTKNLEKKEKDGNYQFIPYKSILN